jgi:hypothetical protein
VPIITSHSLNAFLSHSFFILKLIISKSVN